MQHQAISNPLEGLTPKQARALLKELNASQSTSSLASYSEYVHGWEPAAHHKEWIAALEDESIRVLIIIAPPGHAKTNYVGVAYPSWQIGRDPSSMFLYICRSDPMAWKVSMDIRDTIKSSDRYHEIFPQVKPHQEKSWSASSWYVHRAVSAKDATFCAAGVFGSVLGARCTHLVLDDLNDFENSRTDDQLKKVNDWVKTVCRSRVVNKSSHYPKGGRIVAIFTRWHDNDLYQVLSKLPGAVIIHMPALGYRELCAMRTAGVLDRWKSNKPKPLLKLDALGNVLEVCQKDTLTNARMGHSDTLTRLDGIANPQDSVILYPEDSVSNLGILGFKDSRILYPEDSVSNPDTQRQDDMDTESHNPNLILVNNIQSKYRSNSVPSAHLIGNKVVGIAREGIGYPVRTARARARGANLPTIAPDAVRLTASDPGNVLSLPALLPTDPPGTKWLDPDRFDPIIDGSALWPEVWPKTSPDPEQATLMGIYGTDPDLFQLMYQGNTEKQGGNIFRREWFNRRYLLTDYLAGRLPMRLIFQSLDAASKTDNAHDYSVLLTLGLGYDGNVYLIHRVKERLTYPELEATVVSQYAAFSPVFVIVEDRSAGIQVIQSLQANTLLPVVDPKSLVEPHKRKLFDRDKRARAMSCCGLFSAGKVFLPDEDSAPWTRDYIDNMCRFPNGSHDDDVDATTQAGILIVTHELLVKQAQLTGESQLSYDRAGIRDEGGNDSLDPLFDSMVGMLNVREVMPQMDWDD